MTKQEFIDWLDTIIPLGCSDWDIREEFDGGNIMNIDKAMPKQVFVQSKSVISIEEIRKQKYE